MKRISKRDLLCIKYVAEQKVVQLNVLDQLLKIHGIDTDKRTLQQLAEKWVEMGYIKKERILAQGPSVLWPTKEGIKLAGLDLQKGERFDFPSLANLVHDLTVSRVRLEYERFQATWISERTLRTNFSSDYLPDGYAIINGLEVIVEVDITAKHNKRLYNIMRSHSRHPNISSVDYWTPDELREFVSNAVQIVNTENGNNLIRTFILPKEGNYEKNR